MISVGTKKFVVQAHLE